MGRQDVAAPLRENLAQEQHMLEEVRRAAERIAEETLSRRDGAPDHRAASRVRRRA